MFSFEKLKYLPNSSARLLKHLLMIQKVFEYRNFENIDIYLKKKGKNNNK